MLPPPTWPGYEARMLQRKAKEELGYFFFFFLGCKDCQMVVKSSKDHCQVVKSYVGRWGGLKTSLVCWSHFICTGMEPPHGWYSTTGNVSNVARW